MFRIRNKDNGAGEICGVTEKAINSYFETNDTPEDAERNLKKYHNHIISKVVVFIEKGRANSQGYYILGDRDFDEW
ncbi:MAG: hypothetical protein DHS20C07_31400 [Methyloligella sp.]|nr:MAG: hypothetical protein DHS20C07_31400 [Methyloligella sp.]